MPAIWKNLSLAEKISALKELEVNSAAQKYPAERYDVSISTIKNNPRQQGEATVVGRNNPYFSAEEKK